MSFTLFDFPELLDFNYSAGQDPGLGPAAKVSEQQLIRWAIELRAVERDPLADFIDTMHTTLRRAAFETFQRVHGPRPIDYREFFLSKLHQYCSLLIHDSVEIADADWLYRPARTPCPWEEARGRPLRAVGDYLDPDELEAAFDPDQNDDQPWFDLINVCREAGNGERLACLTGFLRQIAEARNKVDRRQVDVRDALIAKLAQDGADRVRICAELDLAGVPVSANMKKAGIKSWQEADQRKDLRRNIQTIISKAKAKAVKS